ncbi:MAG: peptidoglycan DD-metalloendopeptidase family protein [Oscillospiraceae bacterium]|nr:peptidoglycan DD-metalloendopeptidase family protein [Oscillospiraceae bacterium]
MRNRKLWVSILSGVLAVIMVLSLVVGVLPGVVNAASLGALQQQVNDLKDKRKEIQAEIDELEGKLSANLESMAEVVAQKNNIDQQVFKLYEQITNLNEQISTYNLLIADKQAELDAAQARWEELNKKNKERIRAMEEDGNLSYWSVLFKANSFADLLDRLNMVREIAAADRRRLKEMSDAAEAIANAKEVLETEKTALEATRVELDEAQKVLEEKRAEADRLLAELVATGAEYQKYLDEVESKAAANQSELDAAQDRLEAAEREQWLSTSVPAKPVGTPGNVSTSSRPVDGLTWVSPCNYVLLTSPFGWRTHPIHGDYRFHYGVDLAGPIGTPIVATRSGVVTTTTYDSSSGYYVVVDHQDGYVSKYLHLTHYIVSPGTYVNAGQVIGYMGSTGASTGSHLHFSIQYNGSHVNPMDYIR